MGDKIREFIESRTAVIDVARGAVSLHEAGSGYKPKVVLHVISLTSITGVHSLLSHQSLAPRDLVPLGCHSSSGGRFNLEGLCTYKRDGFTHSPYAQLG
jgi:hypothetical protein